MGHLVDERGMGVSEAGGGERGWWREVSVYQWVVLAVACAGWIFDIYEAQIFAVMRGGMLKDLLHVSSANDAGVKQWGDAINSYFLIGGAVGGVLFGMIADRWGRGRAMVGSILVYATFSALTAAAQAVWQVAALRFLVAMGTGGEWAVAAALVAEVFPKRARAHASGLFHASSILGVLAAAGAGIVVGNNWRAGFLLGLLPALLVFAVRVYVREPREEKAEGRGQKAEEAEEAAGRVETGPAQAQVQPVERRGFGEFWRNREYRRRAGLGLVLAGIGLAGYWGVYVGGLDLARAFLLHHGVEAGAAEVAAKKAYGFYQLIGGAAGLFAMGPLCAWLGRRRAFVVMQVGAIVVTPVMCYGPTSYVGLVVMLAVMGFFVNGMHAGYAVWFPELFPARLRATGAGICFNGARLLAAPMLAVAGWLKGRMDLRGAVCLLGMVYVVGVVVAVLLPETKGEGLEGEA